MRKWVGLLVMAAAGCSHSPAFPDAAPFQPLAIYAEWWAEARACTGMDARLERIRWYEVPVLPASSPTRDRLGAWEPPHTIYLEPRWMGDKTAVQHEMVHDLLQGDPTHTHECFSSLSLL